jgi:four helix bundle suffix protein
MENTTKKPAGIQSTLVYWLAVEISNLNEIFCELYISRFSRTYDQMIQAARSGKQNLVEGSLENSSESNIKLTGVSRASYGELAEDYKDYLWKKSLPVWEKNDARTLSIRRCLIDIHKPHSTHTTHSSHGIEFNNPEAFANLMLTLCTKEGYLLDKFLIGIQERFIKQGGLKENLFRKRLEYRKTQ